MSNEILVPAGTCEESGLPKKARFNGITIGPNGSFDLKIVEDVYNRDGTKVFKAGTEVKSIQYVPFAMNNGDEIIEQSLTPAQQKLVDAVFNSSKKVIEEFYKEKGVING